MRSHQSGIALTAAAARPVDSRSNAKALMSLARLVTQLPAATAAQTSAGDAARRLSKVQTQACNPMRRVNPLKVTCRMPAASGKGTDLRIRKGLLESKLSGLAWRPGLRCARHRNVLIAASQHRRLRKPQCRHVLQVRRHMLTKLANAHITGRMPPATNDNPTPYAQLLTLLYCEPQPAGLARAVAEDKALVWSRMRAKLRLSP